MKEEDFEHTNEVLRGIFVSRGSGTVYRINGNTLKLGSSERPYAIGYVRRAKDEAGKIVYIVNYSPDLKVPRNGRTSELIKSGVLERIFGQ